MKKSSQYLAEFIITMAISVAVQADPVAQANSPAPADNASPAAQGQNADTKPAAVNDEDDEDLPCDKEKEESYLRKNKFEPDIVMLDANNQPTTLGSSGAQLGLKYDFESSLNLHTCDPRKTKQGGEVLGSSDKGYQKVQNGPTYVFNAKGTLTNHADSNPESLQEASLTMGYTKRFSQNKVRFGITGKYEASQNGNSAQTVMGGSAMFKLRYGNPLNNWLIAFLNVGKVDVKDDPLREAIDANDTSYNRADGEIVLLQTVQTNGVKDLQISYRYFQEIGASDLIKGANLDTTHYATYRIRFNKGFYVAYSTGHLPFDIDSGGTAKIGWQTDFDLKTLSGK